jgi:hypothetical protein
MKYRQVQRTQATAGDLEATKNGELSDAALDAVIGGRTDAALGMEAQKDAVSTDIQTKPINELLGKVRNFDRA